MLWGPIVCSSGAGQSDTCTIHYFRTCAAQQAEGRCYNFDAPIMFYIDSYNATYAHVEKAKSAAERAWRRLRKVMTFLGYLSDKYRAPMQV